MKEKILNYIESWKSKGYPEDIPDTVPLELMRLNLAPSYQAICLAILRNDISLQSIGYTPPKSDYYYALKGMEFNRERGATPDVKRNDAPTQQLELFT